MLSEALEAWGAYPNEAIFRFSPDYSPILQLFQSKMNEMWDIVLYQTVPVRCVISKPK